MTRVEAEHKNFLQRLEEEPMPTKISPLELRKIAKPKGALCARLGCSRPAAYYRVFKGRAGESRSRRCQQCAEDFASRAKIAMPADSTEGR